MSVSIFGTKLFYRDKVILEEDNKTTEGTRAKNEEDKYSLLSNNKTNYVFEDETYKGSKKEIRIFKD